MGVDGNGIGGHSELALERYRDTTRHMVIYDVLVSSPRGKAGDRMRLFLADAEYAAIKHAEETGTIKIMKHAAVIEGHILPDRKRHR